VNGDRFELLLRALSITPTRRGVARFLGGLGAAEAKRNSRKKQGKRALAQGA
jgi:hypothetical protein